MGESSPPGQKSPLKAGASKGLKLLFRHEAAGIKAST
jgi:hypothetical protein